MFDSIHIIVYDAFTSNYSTGRHTMTPFMQSVLHLSNILREHNIISLLDRLAEHDHSTWRHSISTAEYAIYLGCRLGLSKLQLYDLAKGALLHDIGKLKISPELIRKQGIATEEEYKELQKHTEYGRQILKEEGFPKTVTDSAAFHHVNFDGTGYPKTDARPSVLVNIIHIADAYDALTRERPYRSAVPSNVAKELMGKDTETYYSPDAMKFLTEI